LVSGTNGNNNALNGSNGADLLLGLNGNDTLTGGGGADVMVGGAGTDRFVFTAANSANGDAITDFHALSEVGAAHDIIDVSGIDANGNLPGNGTFTYGGETAAFTARGQLIYYLDSGSGHYMLAGNTDANSATAEFQIDLGATHKNLASADLAL
jgi:serralysin